MIKKKAKLYKHMLKTLLCMTKTSADFEYHR